MKYIKNFHWQNNRSCQQYPEPELNSQEIITAWTHIGKIIYLLGNTGKSMLKKGPIGNKE